MILLVLQLLTLKVTPSVCFEPCKIRIEARVQRHEDNRHLEVTIDGNQYLHSEVDLNGKDAPYLSVFEFKNLTEGEYSIEATVIQLHKRVGAGQGLKVVSSKGYKVTKKSGDR